MRRRAIATLLLCSLFLSGEHGLLAQGVDLEYQVKAAFLFNFAKFIEWPGQALSADMPFTICLTSESFAGVLEGTLRNETLNGKPLVLRRLSTADDPRQCQILFISAAEARRTVETLNAIGNAPVLTVGEDADFITNGGMIRFTQTGRQIHFEINPDAAQRTSLKISSRLLRVAEVVRPPNGVRR